MRELRKLVKDLPRKVREAELRGPAVQDVYSAFKDDGVSADSHKKSWDAFHDWLTVRGHQYSVENCVPLGYLKHREMYPLGNPQLQLPRNLQVAGVPPLPVVEEFVEFKDDWVYFL